MKIWRVTSPMLHNGAFRRTRGRVGGANAVGVLAISSLLLAAQALGQRRDTLSLGPGAYPVGFQLLAEQDRSRFVVANDGATYARPIRVYVWYPATAASKPMRLGRYAELADEDIWPAEISGRTRDVLKFSRGPLARSLDPVALEALLQRPVLAAENARFAPGRFPLIAIGLGLYFESPITFEDLAEHLAGQGFVVVTVPLVGTNSALVRIDAQDLETQVRDLEFAVARARQLPFVRPDRLGVLGFDMGGMAGVILAMRDPSVDAFASIGSGILYPHPSGLPQALASHDVAALRVPWLHATSVGPARERPEDHPGTQSLFDAAVHSNRYLLDIPGMDHVDFTSYALIDGRRATRGYWTEAGPAATQDHKIVADYVSHFFSAFLRTDAGSAAWIARDPQSAFPGSQMTLDHRTATTPSIGYDDLVLAILKGDAETAVERLRLANGTGTTRAVLDEVHLERLGYSLLYTWGLAREALPLLRYTAEQYPASVQARAMLADGYVLLENYSAAIDILSKLLAEHPDNVSVRARLEEVRALQGKA